MDLEITYRDIPESDRLGLAEEFRHLAERHLDRHVAHFAPDLLRLRIVVEESKHHSNIRTVRLRLTVPGGQLTSEKTADSFQAAAKDAFGELERQLIERLERMRGEDEWKRVQRREQLRRLRAAISERPPEQRINFTQAIRPHLSKLRRWAQFEISHLRARGQLMSDYPSVDDLIDEALARAYRDPDLLKNPAEVAPRLFRILIDVGEEEAANDRKQRQTLSLEAHPPREPTDIEIDETFYDFFQPDEVTKVEDLASDPSPDPEEIVARNEMQQRIASLVASLPSAWRRAIMLARVEGMPLSTVAKVLNTTEDEVREWLDRADNFLRARLADEGIVSLDRGEPNYLEKARSSDASEMEAAFDSALESSDQ